MFVLSCLSLSSTLSGTLWFLPAEVTTTGIFLADSSTSSMFSVLMLSIRSAPAFTAASISSGSLVSILTGFSVQPLTAFTALAASSGWPPPAAIPTSTMSTPDAAKSRAPLSILPVDIIDASTISASTSIGRDGPRKVLRFPAPMIITPLLLLWRIASLLIVDRALSASRKVVLLTNSSAGSVVESLTLPIAFRTIGRSAAFFGPFLVFMLVTSSIFDVSPFIRPGISTRSMFERSFVLSALAIYSGDIKDATETGSASV